MVVVVVELVSSKTSRTLSVLLFLGHTMLKTYSWFCDQGSLHKVLRDHMQIRIKLNRLPSRQALNPCVISPVQEQFYNFCNKFLMYLFMSVKNSLISVSPD